MSNKSSDDPISANNPRMKGILEDKEKVVYITNKLLDKISNIRKQLDKLLLILLTGSIFGLVHINPPKEGWYTIPILELKIPGDLFNLSVSAILLIVFGVIGSLLIDYIRNRAMLDFYAEDYLSSNIEEPGNKSSFAVEKENEINKQKRVLISDIFVSASFYEWMYRLAFHDITTSIKRLWLPVSFLILLVFYFSHFVAFIHIFKQYGNNMFSALTLYAVWGISFVALYYTFIFSIRRANKRLGDIMAYSVYSTVVIFLLLSFYWRKEIFEMINNTN